MSDAAQLQRWLDAAISGDGAALGDLLDAHRDRLRETIHADIHGPLQRRFDASDVVQQACVAAVRDFPNFRGSTVAEFWVWLRTIEQNRLVDVVREQTAQRRNAKDEQSVATGFESPGHGTTASQHAMRGERRRQLEAAITQLPDGQREAVRLRYLRELKIADIASELDRSEEAVAGLLKRGVRALKQTLKGESL